MLGNWGGKLLVIGWFAFLGAFTLLAYTDFALILNAKWCGDADQHCFREWVSATSGWAATVVAGGSLFLLIRQITDASRSVDIASETLKENRISAERQLRAYVYTGQTKFERKQGTVVITLEITNHGQTPARDVVVRRTAYIGSEEDIQNFEEGEGYSAIGDLAPTQTRYSRAWPAAADFRKHETQIEAGETFIHLYATVTYRDVFGGERETTFRLISPRVETGGYMLLKEAVRST